MSSEPTPVLVAHYFRHEYGRVVSSLVRVFGAHRLELIEDAVQGALGLALTSWGQKGVPDVPGAWLSRVARNQVVDQLRRQGAAERSIELELPVLESPQLDEACLAGEITDDELRMLFVCCDPRLPQRMQLVLSLKILCGFSVQEIALRLLLSEEATQKRLSRGRAQFRKWGAELHAPSGELLKARVGAVHQVLYLLFNEGYSSARLDEPIRRDLCREAIRLTRLLLSHRVGDEPTGWALLALMHFHHARFSARLDESGGLFLLEEQDRGLWDQAEIALGLHCFMKSAAGDVFSRYHAESGVLAEHCRAPTYAQTNWEEIVSLYSLLESIAPSPLHTLNRAIALSEWKGPGAGLSLLNELTPPAWLVNYYLWDASLGELNRRVGKLSLARKHLERALLGAPTTSEKRHIQRRLDACEE